MSRVMEIVSPDPPEIVAKKAYIAFKRVRGRVLEYNPAQFVEGKVYVGSVPAFMTVEWTTHRDGERIRLDISATSGDELNRAADMAMYRFADAFKAVTAEDAARPLTNPARTVGIVASVVIAAGLAAAYFLHLPPF